MNWLVIQSDGEHKGQDGWCPNWMFRECHAIACALRRLGCRVDVWGLRHANFHEKPDLRSYDHVLVAENYDFSWLPDLTAAKQVLFWMIDGHIEPAGRYAPILRQSHVVLHATRRLIPACEAAYPTARHLYFPNGVDDRFFDADLFPGVLATEPLIFIGGCVGERKVAVDWMTQRTGLKFSYGVTGMDYVKAVLAAKMQFNKPVNGDINYRTWETIGLGRCLLTQFDPELEVLGFRHEVNCLLYRTLDEAAALARQYLDSGEWAFLGAAGHQLAKRHSYTARMHTLTHQLGISPRGY